tara:strand:+ start:4331 stop:5632 length:1302 start_codon:yes stop_codon:yes gene_type:complete
MKKNKIFLFIIEKLNKSDFSKNVFTLVTGTAIAQIIPLLVAPILSRIYTPQEFGRLALYMSIVQILGAIANGRYELAIVLPKEKKKGVQLTILSISISIIVSIIVLFVVLLFSNTIANALGDPKLDKWLFLVPISVLMIGCFNALNYFNTREKAFKNIAKANIFKSLGGSITQLSLGLLKLTGEGLIVGQAFSHFFGNIKMGKTFLNNKEIIKSTTTKDLIKLAKRYVDFPKFSMFGIFLNTASINVTNLFISSIYNLTNLGFFSIAYRYLGLPSALMGNAISQVYMQNLTSALIDKKDIFQIFKKTLYKVFIISCLFLLFGVLFVKPIFVLYLGKDWFEAGVYAQILVPLFAVRFIVSCLSITLIVLEKQRVELFVHLSILLSTIVVLISSTIFNLEIKILIVLYSLVLVINYLIILLYIFLLIKKINVERN